MKPVPKYRNPIEAPNPNASEENNNFKTGLNQINRCNIKAQELILRTNVRNQCGKKDSTRTVQDRPYSGDQPHNLFIERGQMVQCYIHLQHTIPNKPYSSYPIGTNAIRPSGCPFALQVTCSAPLASARSYSPRCACSAKQSYWKTDRRRGRKAGEVRTTLRCVVRHYKYGISVAKVQIWK